MLPSSIKTKNNVVRKYEIKDCLIVAFRKSKTNKYAPAIESVEANNRIEKIYGNNIVG